MSSTLLLVSGVFPVTALLVLVVNGIEGEPVASLTALLVSRILRDPVAAAALRSRFCC